MTPKTSGNRASNVYTINVPKNFKDAVLEQSQQFGGASQIITLSLDDLALRVRKMKNRINIIEELNDYIKLEVLLMKRYEEESKKKREAKLSFRLKDQVSQESLMSIKKKTGWSTSKTVRISLLWYLYANFDEFVASENFVPLLKCSFCGFVTHDQRALGVHIQTLHETVCPYCGKHHPITEDHHCKQKEAAALHFEETPVSQDQTTIDQFTSVPLADLDLDESNLMRQLGLSDLGSLKPSEEESKVSDLSSMLPDKEVFDESEAQLETISDEISRVGGTLVDLPDGSSLKDVVEERRKTQKSKKAKDEKIDQLQDEISEILESLKEDGLLE
ncbi:MAG: hypothetical protein GPJ51_04640 [Candidatus Heimdallarchaeota archaeon]|nr:hypothetical protein [Candidatus Heimdallarchaeota archaeon]